MTGEKTINIKAFNNFTRPERNAEKGIKQLVAMKIC